MKFFSVSALLLVALQGNLVAGQQEECNFRLAEPPVEMEMAEMDKVVFVGVNPIIKRFEGEPKIRITRYTSGLPSLLPMQDGRTLSVTRLDCGDVLTPTASPSAVSSAKNTMRGSLSAIGLGLSMFLGGASPLVSGLATTLVAGAVGVQAQDDQAACQDIVEVEIHGPVVTADGTEVTALETTIADLQVQVATLTQQVADLQAEKESLFTQEQVDKEIYDYVVEEIAFGDFADLTPTQDQVLSRVSNQGSAVDYDVAGFPIYNEYNPEAQFYLANAGDDSLLRDMQGDGFQFPTTSNEPQDVTFTLTPPATFDNLSDLVYMPIKEIAYLIQNGNVTCVQVVQTFIDRLAEFDPYLGIVATPLYDRALEMAASHDVLLSEETYLGALMCIPFG